jgi:glutamate 5-kinase
MQIAALNDEYEFVIVSSGAIAAAKQFVKLERRQRDYSQTSLGLYWSTSFNANFP